MLKLARLVVRRGAIMVGANLRGKDVASALGDFQAGRKGDLRRDNVRSI